MAQWNVQSIHEWVLKPYPQRCTQIPEKTVREYVIARGILERNDTYTYDDMHALSLLFEKDASKWNPQTSFAWSSSHADYEGCNVACLAFEHLMIEMACGITLLKAHDRPLTSCSNNELLDTAKSFHKIYLHFTKSLKILLDWKNVHTRIDMIEIDADFITILLMIASTCVHACILRSSKNIPLDEMARRWMQIHDTLQSHIRKAIPTSSDR